MYHNCCVLIATEVVKYRRHKIFWRDLISWVVLNHNNYIHENLNTTNNWGQWNKALIELTVQLWPLTFMWTGSWSMEDRMPLYGMALLCYLKPVDGLPDSKSITLTLVTPYHGRWLMMVPGSFLTPGRNSPVGLAQAWPIFTPTTNLRLLFGVNFLLRRNTSQHTQSLSHV